MSDETDKAGMDARLRGLVVATRGGDQAAYRSLLSEAAPLIRRTVRGRIGHWGAQHLIDDIVQETLLAIHLKLHTYDADLPFLAWVNAVARHKLIDHLRRNKKLTLSIDDETMPELIDPVNPEAPGIALDVEKLLGQLKRPAGDIIYALKVEGASVKEVAAKYQRSEANIKVIAHRGLHKLAQLISSSEVCEADATGNPSTPSGVRGD